MNRFSFRRLIQKYSEDIMIQFRLEDTQTFNEDGEPVKPYSEPEKVRMAVIPFDLRSINQSGGMIKQSDRQVYCTFPITHGSTFTHQGMNYKIDTSADFTDFSDFHRYVAKGVDIFDRT